MNNKKNILIVAAAVIILAVIVIIYFAASSGRKSAPTTGTKTPEQKAAEDLDQALEKTTIDIGEVVGGNPLEKMPETNPVDAANPFKDLNTNPFRQ